MIFKVVTVVRYYLLRSLSIVGVRFKVMHRPILIALAILMWRHRHQGVICMDIRTKSAVFFIFKFCFNKTNSLPGITVNARLRSMRCSL